MTILQQKAALQKYSKMINKYTLKYKDMRFYDEIKSTVMLAVLTALDRYNGHGSEVAYVSMNVLFAANNAMREYTKQNRQDDCIKLFDSIVEEKCYIDIIGTVDNAERDIQVNELLNHVNVLNDKERRYLSCYLRGYNGPQTAKMIGVSKQRCAQYYDEIVTKYRNALGLDTDTASVV